MWISRSKNLVQEKWYARLRVEDEIICVEIKNILKRWSTLDTYRHGCVSDGDIGDKILLCLLKVHMSTVEIQSFFFLDLPILYVCVNLKVIQFFWSQRHKILCQTKTDQLFRATWNSWRLSRDFHVRINALSFIFTKIASKFSGSMCLKVTSLRYQPNYQKSGWWKNLLSISIRNEFSRLTTSLRKRRTFAFTVFVCTWLLVTHKVNLKKLKEL